MPRIRNNSGYIGAQFLPTSSGAGGMNTLPEQQQNQQAGNWPSDRTQFLFTDPQFNLTTLLIHADGSNGANNYSILDSSSSPLTVTRNGTPTQGTFSPFSHTGWCNQFNGTTDYITSGTILSFGTGDFTVEGWFYPTTTGTNIPLFTFGTLNAATNLGVFYTSNAGNQTVVRLSSSSADTVTATYVAANVWTHVAVVRTSGVITIYFNGEAATNSSSAGGSTSLTGTTLTLGWSGATVNTFFPGYISNFRSVRGSAVYTANFTPSTIPLTAITNTQLLTCQSNRFIDNSTSPVTITPSGTASVQSFSPLAPLASYGSSSVGGSIYCTATTPDYLTIATTGARVAGLGLGTGAFTIELWAYITSAPNTWQAFFDINSYTSGILMRYQAGSDSLYILGTAYNWDPTTNVKLNSWNHIALSRNAGGVFRVFVNGVSAVTGTNAGDLGATGYMAVNYGLHAAGQNMTAYFSSLRLVKGTAVYDPTNTTITVPTGPLTAVAGTTLLLNGTNAALYDSTAKNNINTNIGGSLSSTQAKFGATSLRVPGGVWSMTNPGPMNTLGSGDFTIEGWFRFDGMGNQRPVTQGASGVGEFLLIFYGSGAFDWCEGTTARVSGTAGAVTANAWYHIAIVRYSGVTKAYINGTQNGNAYTSSYNFSSTNPIYLGGNPGTPSQTMAGYIDEFRISRYARYTANFTVSASAFPSL